MYDIDGQKANTYYELGQQKPFACMSLKPGLGDRYYQEHKAEIWKQGYIQCTNGKPAQITRTGTSTVGCNYQRQNGTDSRIPGRRQISHQYQPNRADSGKR